jgi:hypothetical protein
MTSTRAICWQSDSKPWACLRYFVRTLTLKPEGESIALAEVAMRPRAVVRQAELEPRLDAQADRVSRKRRAVGIPMKSYTRDDVGDVEKCCHATITLDKVDYESNLTTRAVKWPGKVIIGGQETDFGPNENLPQRKTILVKKVAADEDVGGCPGVVGVFFDIILEAQGVDNPFEGTFAYYQITRYFDCPSKKTLKIPVRFLWTREDQKRIDEMPLGPDLVRKIWAMPRGDESPRVTFTFHFTAVLTCK